MVMLSTKNTTVCTGFLFYGGQTACFTDYTNIDTRGWVGFVYPMKQRGDIRSVHTDALVEAGETDYVNPLEEKAIATKWINIA